MHRITLILFLIIACNPYSSSADTPPEYNYSEVVRIQEAEQKARQEKANWGPISSATEIFETKFPKEYKYKVFPFQFNDDTIAFSTELVSTLGGGGSGGKEKTILIKAVQTFGSELAVNTVKSILNREAEKYIKTAEQNGGAVINNEDITHKGFLGKNIYIAYKDGINKYGLRIFIYMTNFAKVEQVISGPSNTMYSYRSDDFFKSIILKDGRVKKENPIGVGWIDYTSKHNVFTAVLPPIQSDYTPKPPSFSTDGPNETMIYRINDPVLDQDVIYQVFTYHRSSPFTRDDMINVLFSGHIAKYIKNAKRSDLAAEEKTLEDGTKLIRTKVVMSPLENIPHINTLLIEIRYKGNSLIAQEFLCGPKHASSGLHKTLFSQLKFHPEKFKIAEPEKTETKNIKPE